MARPRSTLLASGVCALALLGCSSDNGSGQSSDGGSGATNGNSGGTGTGGQGAGAGGAKPNAGGANTNGAGGSSATGAGGANTNGAGGTNTAGSGAGGRGGRGGRAGAGGTQQSGGANGSGGAGPSTGGAGGVSSTGWLHTTGNKIFRTDAGKDTQWIGRGVNMDDIYMCGYNSTLSESTPEKTLESVVSGLMSWKPNFVRISLAMASNSTTSSFLTNPSQYKDPMVQVINAIGANPGVYVLVTLRSDSSMIGQDQTDGDPEATGIPSDSTTTPDKTKFPQGTDPVYVALVDTFANSSFVMFGLTNEPGGNKLSNAKIAAAMDHAVTVIRAEEDKLGTPHHIVSVQGQQWTSDISFYATKPLTQDNVVYEVHGYPPATASYTYSNIPVIIGEYGTLSGNGSAFFADLESKQISSLAFDFEPFSDCAPDLLQVNHSATQLNPTAWGTTVKNYLLAHAM